jgi:hypothetical protein
MSAQLGGIAFLPSYIFVRRNSDSGRGTSGIGGQHQNTRIFSRDLHGIGLTFPFETIGLSSVQSDEYETIPRRFIPEGHRQPDRSISCEQRASRLWATGGTSMSISDAIYQHQCTDLDLLLNLLAEKGFIEQFMNSICCNSLRFSGVGLGNVTGAVSSGCCGRISDWCSLICR